MHDWFSIAVPALGSFTIVGMAVYAFPSRISFLDVWLWRIKYWILLCMIDLYQSRFRRLLLVSRMNVRFPSRISFLDGRWRKLTVFQILRCTIDLLSIAFSALVVEWIEDASKIIVAWVFCMPLAWWLTCWLIRLGEPEFALITNRCCDKNPAHPKRERKLILDDKRQEEARRKDKR